MNKVSLFNFPCPRSARHSPPLLSSLFPVREKARTVLNLTQRVLSGDGAQPGLRVTRSQSSSSFGSHGAAFGASPNASPYAPSPGPGPGAVPSLYRSQSIDSRSGPPSRHQTMSQPSPPRTQPPRGQVRSPTRSSSLGSGGPVRYTNPLSDTDTVGAYADVPSPQPGEEGMYYDVSAPPSESGEPRANYPDIDPSSYASEGFVNPLMAPHGKEVWAARASKHMPFSPVVLLQFFHLHLET